MTNKELAQAWVQQEQPRGMNGNKTFSFEGPTLYSYSTPIAWIDPEKHFVFFSSTSYSTTTSTNHMSPAQRYTPDYYARLYPARISTLKEMIFDCIKQLFETLKTLHRKKHLDFHCTEYARDRAAILEVCKAYDLTPPAVPEISTAGYLFDDLKSAVLRAQQEVKSC